MLFQISTLWQKIWEWLQSPFGDPINKLDPSYGNLIKIGVTIFVLLLIVVINRLIVGSQLRKAVERGKIDKTARQSIQRIVRLVLVVFYVILVFSMFASEASGVVTGIFAFSGATIIGFASMNTIGNAIAGLIIMVSKPFRVGDRVRYQDKLADIVMIRFVFTKLRYLDNTEISVPNQEFLNTGLVNLGQKSHITTRSIVFGLDYKLDPDMVIEEVTRIAFENPHIEKPSDEDAQASSATSSKILESISKLTLESPEVELNLNPKVHITKFLDYAVEYTLYYKARVEVGFRTETEIRKALLIWSQENGYDLSTTVQIKNI